MSIFQQAKVEKEAIEAQSPSTEVWLIVHAFCRYIIAIRNDFLTGTRKKTFSIDIGLY